MIPTCKSFVKGDHSIQPWLTVFISMTMLLGLIAVNYALPFPDINDLWRRRFVEEHRFDLLVPRYAVLRDVFGTSRDQPSNAAIT